MLEVSVLGSGAVLRLERDTLDRSEKMIDGCCRKGKRKIQPSFFNVICGRNVMLPQKVGGVSVRGRNGASSRRDACSVVK